ncbi:hypothetical protein D3Z51_18370 [Clostridiaceae bacterium]|nr:hypothetical protein [Clostridiaceae bacterium]RKI09145.1 hypothetical protein D7V81_17950 [bacterium 1XD21-70]
MIFATPVFPEILFTSLLASAERAVLFFYVLYSFYRVLLPYASAEACPAASADRTAGRYTDRPMYKLAGL